MIRVYDTNRNGVIPTSYLQIVLKVALISGGVVLPALALGDMATICDIKLHRASKLAEEISERMVGDEPWIHCDELACMMGRHARFILGGDVGEVRERLEKYSKGGGHDKEVVGIWGRRASSFLDVVETR